MIQKELNEIRRRFNYDKNNISRLYGCYVNGNKEIISYIDESLSLMPQEEQTMYLGLLKKSLSGSLGKNLLDISFTSEQVMEGEEHRLLQALRQSALEDEAARERLYRTIIESIEMGESNYLILMAADTYDVPFRGRDDAEMEDASENMFKYFVCSICPVKDASLALRFDHDERMFHSCSTGNTVTLPTIGFMFPTFEDRSANIYNVQYYCRKPDEIHEEVIDALFHVEPPMNAVEQKIVFNETLCEVLEKDCSYDVVQSVHEQLRGRIEEHKESKAPENLDLSIADVGYILAQSGVSDEKVKEFRSECEKQYGEYAVLNPNNIIDSKKFEVCTPQIKISVAPEESYLIETRVIDGSKYILIPAGDGVEINGIAVSIGEETEKEGSVIE